MSKNVNAVDDSLLKTYHRKAVEFSGICHRLGLFGSSGSLEIGDNRQLTFQEFGEKNLIIQIDEFSEPPLAARFILRYRGRLDMVDGENQYICPRDIGSAALETHIQLADAAQQHLQSTAGSLSS